MTRLIDADALKELMIEVLEHIKENPKMDGQERHIIAGIHMLGEMIDDAPTVDAVPVRHGKWLDPETFNRPWFRHHIFECSVCRNTLDMDGVNAGRGDANYCPNCGAKMDAERKEE